MNLKDKWKLIDSVLPSVSNSDPGPYYVSVSNIAGCKWGLLIKKDISDIYVLTSYGIKYYGCPSEHELLIPGDEEYDYIHHCWNIALNTLRMIR